MAPLFSGLRADANGEENGEQLAEGANHSDYDTLAGQAKQVEAAKVAPPPVLFVWGGLRSCCYSDTGFCLGATSQLDRRRLRPKRDLLSAA